MANILIENEKQDFLLGEELLRKIHAVADRVIEEEEFYEDAEISLTFVGLSEIRELNREYRGKDQATDVLSFPMYEREELLQIDEVYEDEVLALGDIVLCVDRAKEQAEEYGHSLEREICFLICHSLLHLFGYDHENEEEEKRMRKKEESVLQSLGICR